VQHELAQQQAVVGQTQAMYARLLANADEDVAVRQGGLTLLTTAIVAPDHAWLSTVLRFRLSEASAEAKLTQGCRRH
jgi:hypothetical protein